MASQKPEKGSAEWVLRELSQGRSREELARTLNIRKSSLDQRMRRKGLFWSDAARSYVPPGSQSEVKVPDLPPKVLRILSEFDQSDPDATLIANQNGFADVKELGRYMLTHGARWSNELQRYVIAGALDTAQSQSDLPSADGGDAVQDLPGYATQPPNDSQCNNVANPNGTRFTEHVSGPSSDTGFRVVVHVEKVVVYVNHGSDSPPDT